MVLEVLLGIWMLLKVLRDSKYSLARDDLLQVISCCCDFLDRSDNYLLSACKGVWS